MSEAISALAGARASGMVDLADAGAVGMITLRGDLDTLGAALTSVLGLELPGVRQATASDAAQALWMSPDELLVVLGYAEAPAVAERLAVALGDNFASVAVVSDARALIRITGAQARDVLAKLMPVDFTDFPVGSVRRSRAAQVAAALWRVSDTEWSLVCFRSVAGYVWEALATVAQPGGEVGLYR